jgi:hypothetical protein
MAYCRVAFLSYEHKNGKPMRSIGFFVFHAFLWLMNPRKLRMQFATVRVDVLCFTAAYSANRGFRIPGVYINPLTRANSAFNLQAFAVDVLWRSVEVTANAGLRIPEVCTYVSKLV